MVREWNLIKLYNIVEHVQQPVNLLAVRNLHMSFLARWPVTLIRSRGATRADPQHGTNAVALSLSAKRAEA